MGDVQEGGFPTREKEGTPSAQDFRPKPSCFLFWGLWLDHLGDGQWQSSDGL